MMEPITTKDYLIIPNEVMITKGHVMIPSIVITAMLVFNLVFFVFFGSLWNLAAIVVITPILVMTIRNILKDYSPTTGFIRDDT